jgi:phage terminase large subunit-like protein
MSSISESERPASTNASHSSATSGTWRWRRPPADTLAASGSTSSPAESVVRVRRGVLQALRGRVGREGDQVSRTGRSVVIRILFGWKSPRRNAAIPDRVHRDSQRKNGKSFLCSALSLYLLIADGEPGAQVYSFATKEEQATIVWRGAVAMVEAESGTRTVHGHQQPAEKGRNDSLSSALGRFFGRSDRGRRRSTAEPARERRRRTTRAQGRRVWDVLKTAMGARRQPLQIEITTAGVYDKESIGWEQHKYAQDILDGVFEDDTFVRVHLRRSTMATTCSTSQPKSKANPNYGISVKPSMLASRPTASRVCSQGSTTTTSGCHLNRWTQQVAMAVARGNGTHATRWTPAQAFERAWRGRGARGRQGYGGLDLSSKIDI